MLCLCLHIHASTRTIPAKSGATKKEAAKARRWLHELEPKISWSLSARLIIKPGTWYAFLIPAQSQRTDVVGEILTNLPTQLHAYAAFSGFLTFPDTITPRVTYHNTQSPSSVRKQASDAFRRNPKMEQIVCSNIEQQRTGASSMVWNLCPTGENNSREEGSHNYSIPPYPPPYML